MTAVALTGGAYASLSLADGSEVMQHDNSGVELRKGQLCQQPFALLQQTDKLGIARVGRAVLRDEAQYLSGSRAGMVQLLHRAAITPELLVVIR